MLEFLIDRFANSDGFVLDLFLTDGSQLLRCSTFKSDAVGLVVEDSEGEFRLVPWSSIQTITYEGD